MQDYWFRQSPDKPLFPDLLWSRPENRVLAGKLMIAGGNAHGFAAPAEAFVAAEQAGIGVARVLLPDALQKSIGAILEAGEFAPSTPSGSFAQKALAEFLSMAGWADGVLLDGDMGRNSETAILLEKFLEKYRGLLTLSSDTADYFLARPEAALDRPQTLLGLSFAQMQRLFTGAHFPRALTSGMDAVRLVEALHNFSLQHHAHLLMVHDDTAFIASEGRVGSMKHAEGHPPSISRAAARASVWWLQNPGKPFESAMTSLAA